MASVTTTVAPEQQKLFDEIIVRFRQKEHENQVPNEGNTMERNVLLIGRTKSGKTTTINVWKNPTVVCEDPTLLHQHAKAEIYKIEDPKSMLTIMVVDTIGLSDSREDCSEQLMQLYERCKKAAMTEFHLICYCISIDEGIRQQDIACIQAMEKTFGVNIRSNLCLLVTRCESKMPQQMDRRFTELKNDFEFQKVASWFKCDFYAAGALKFDDWNQGNRSIIGQFENIYRYRENIFNLIKKNIKPVQLQLLQEESTSTSPLLTEETLLPGDHRPTNGPNFSSRDIRVLLLHEFYLGHKATEAVKNISKTIGNNVLRDSFVQNFFKRCESYDFEIENLLGCQSTMQTNVNHLQNLIEKDSRLTLQCLAERLERPLVAVKKEMDLLEWVQQYNVWVLLQLSSHQYQARVDACMNLTRCYFNSECLNNLVTGDEKCVLYIKYKREINWLRSYLSPSHSSNVDRDLTKVIISIWWGFNGIFHWEILPENFTMTADYYHGQMDQLHEHVKSRQKQVYFLHDNNRSYINATTRNKLLQYGWITVPHPHHSPDLSPTDYHLFPKLSTHFYDKTFNDEKDLKKELKDFLEQLPKSFYQQGSFSLPQRWQQVTDTDGAYIKN